MGFGVAEAPSGPQAASLRNQLTALDRLQVIQLEVHVDHAIFRRDPLKTGPKGCRVDQSRQHAAVDNAIGLQMTMGEIQLHPGKILLDVSEAETDMARKGTLVGLGDDLLNVGWIDLGHAGLQAMVRRRGRAKVYPETHYRTIVPLKRCGRAANQAPGCDIIGVARGLVVILHRMPHQTYFGLFAYASKNLPFTLVRPDAGRPAPVRLRRNARTAGCVARPSNRCGRSTGRGPAAPDPPGSVDSRFDLAVRGWVGVPDERAHRARRRCPPAGRYCLGRNRHG